jgi:hypothetical protein
VVSVPVLLKEGPDLAVELLGALDAADVPHARQDDESPRQMTSLSGRTE